MEATIQSNQMDLDKEEERPDLEGLPQERHIWRIQEVPPFPKEKELEITPSLEKEEPVTSTSSKPPIRYSQFIMDVKFNKIDPELKKFTANIKDLKSHDGTFTQWFKVTNYRLESISSTYDRIGKKSQLKNDNMEDLSMTHINDELTTLKNHVLEIAYTTNSFATHLARSDSERQKLKNVIIAHVDKIHKNY
ncbi:hypothetical protein O181_003004 [Austropuccinia psidii MF-1]|uniref:Uncharacterized protein n=1 Tax=Austropuccinia psidii MF-1 TaxID=1389203 RepID=A0A9Q3BDC2_9BASI|nr:hypothetical protein [Austropuccinia psidii MF-1]